jgi:hypothetical protein
VSGAGVVPVGAGDACRLWLPVVRRLSDVDLRALVDVDTAIRSRAMAEAAIAAARTGGWVDVAQP